MWLGKRACQCGSESDKDSRSASAVFLRVSADIQKIPSAQTAAFQDFSECEYSAGDCSPMTVTSLSHMALCNGRYNYPF